MEWLQSAGCFRNCPGRCYDGAAREMGGAGLVTSHQEPTQGSVAAADNTCHTCNVLILHVPYTLNIMQEECIILEFFIHSRDPTWNFLSLKVTSFRSQYIISQKMVLQPWIQQTATEYWKRVQGFIVLCQTVDFDEYSVNINFVFF